MKRFLLALLALILFPTLALAAPPVASNAPFNAASPPPIGSTTPNTIFTANTNGPGWTNTIHVITGNISYRSFIQTIDITAQNGRGYASFTDCQNNSDHTTYVHCVGHEVDCSQNAASGSNGGSDCYGWIFGMHSPAGVHPGAAFRCEHNNYASYPGTITTCFTNTPGVTNVIMTAGPSAVDNVVSPGSNNTANSARINFCGVNAGTTLTTCPYIVGTAYGDISIQANSGAKAQFGPGITAIQALEVGSNGTVSCATGDICIAKTTSSATGPGAGFLKLEVVAGTNAGSCKIQLYAGTSNTPVTLMDNVGSGC